MKVLLMVLLALVFIPASGAATINGTSGADLRFGTTLTDEMYLFAGGDEAHGRSGDDYISGGNGVDKLWGGQGKDDVVGGDGADRLYAGCMNNPPPSYGITECPTNPGSGGALHGGDEDDVLGADNGEYDKLYGDNGFDTCYGDSGDYFNSCERVYKNGVLQ